MMNPDLQGVIYEDIIEYRGLCPNCDIGIHTYKLGEEWINENKGIIIYFQCMMCGTTIYQEWKEGGKDRYILDKMYPKRSKISRYSDEIKSISEDFIKIFNEAETAENNNLFNICGAGYRKALEFLIKDYIIMKNPDIEDEVKSKFLGQCINTHIKDARIKDTAQRATWIGNDETHYERKWETKDMNDLKDFIQLIIFWIESELQYEKMLREMPSRS